MIINSTNQLRPIRADSSYKFLTKFDYMDNNFLFYNYHQFSSLNLSKILIQTEFDFSSSKINLLMVGTILEILTQQRIFIQNSSKKTFSKLFYSKSTLRKIKLLVFLDICLASFFLDKLTPPLIFSYNKINKKLHVFFPTKFAEKLNSYSNLQYSIQIFNYLNQDKKLNFLPNTIY